MAFTGFPSFQYTDTIKLYSLEQGLSIPNRLTEKGFFHSETMLKTSSEDESMQG